MSDRELLSTFLAAMKTAKGIAAKPGLNGVHVRLDETDSTNAEALKLAKNGAEHGTVVTALFQSAGRGRGQRTWEAPKGSSLLCSTILHDPPKLLPLIVGIAAAETAVSFTDQDIALKWPNDIVVNEAGRVRKLGGVLVQARPQQNVAVAGLGLNVAVDLDQLPPELAVKAATLGLVEEQIDSVLEKFLQNLGSLLAEDADSILSRWKIFDLLLGNRIEWNAEPDAEVGSTGSGIAADIDRDGRLVVHGDDGALHSLDAADVHIIR